MARVLILGAGFGGLTVATELRRLLGEKHEITLIDRGEHFTMGLRKLWALVEMGHFEDGSRPRELLNQRGVRFLRREILRIDPRQRRVATDQGDLEAEYLVVALGAEPRPDLIPGFVENAHNVWDAEAVPGLRTALGRLRHGHIAIVIAGVPYSCPPAPYECAMLLDDYLRGSGRRERTPLTVVTLQPMLLPNAGKAGSAWLAEQLSARDIEFRVGRQVERFEAGRIVFADGELEADLVIGVAPHRVPAAIEGSGLTGEGEWIRVDPATLSTAYEKVFAVGDVTQITLANGLALPKAGVMAEHEGRVVAAAIAADLRGEAAQPGFDGRGYCFLETGKSEAALIDGDFFAEPEPRVELQGVSTRHAEEKHHFEAERLALWFGEA